MEIIELFKLFGTIDLKDEASKGLDQVDGKAEKTGSKFGGMAKGIAVAGAAVGAAAIGAGAALFGMAGKAGDHADRLLDLNAITGMSTTSIQEWNQVAKVAGVDTETMTKASSKLTKSMNILETGTGKGADALKGLGVTYDELNAATPDQQMDMLTNALAGIEDPAERARLGTDLFGNSWQDLAPIVAMGADGMADAKDQAHDLGAVMSEDALNDANNFRIGMENLKTMMSAFAMNIGAAVAPVLTNVLLPAFERMIPVITDFGQKIVEWVLKAVDSLGDMSAKVQEWASTNQDRINSLKEGFITAFEAIGEGIRKAGEVLADMTQWVVEHWNILGPILAGIAAGAIAYQVITTAMAAYRAIMLLVTAAQLKMNLAMLANPIGLVVVAIGLLVAAGILLYQNWDLVKEKLSQAWTFIKESAVSIWNGLIEFFTSWGATIMAVLSAAVSLIAQSISAKWEAIRAATTVIWGAITSFFSTTWEIIKAIFSAVITAIVASTKQGFENLKNNITTIFNAVKSFITTVWNGISAFFSSVVSSIVSFVVQTFNSLRSNIMSIFNAVKSFMTSTWNAIKSFVTAAATALVSLVIQRFNNLRSNVTTVFNAIKTFMTNTWNAIKSTVSNLVEGIRSAVTTKFEALKNGVRDKMNATKDTIKNIWDSVMTFFRGIDLAQMGRDMIQGLINGIKGMAGKLLTAVTSLVNDNIPGPIKKILKIASPSKLMHQYGEWTGEGLEGGMEDSASGINKAAEGMAYAAIPNVDPFAINSGVGASMLPRRSRAAAETATAAQRPIIIQPAPVYLDGREISEITFDHNQELFGAASTNAAWLKGVKG
ncbi:phage tail protein [Planococcus dechangensis]|uniref:Phage tail tape measure protein n=1 Tax=Planococcus dechangensis TaxID=1176255 RepID=A0ABV9MC34_9BACL